MSTATKKTFEISRKEASEILRVSTRTLDRYIKSKKLSTKNIAGRIFLSENELTNFIKENRTHRSVKNKKSDKNLNPRIQRTIKSIPVEKIERIAEEEDEVEQTYTDSVLEANKQLRQNIDVISVMEENVYKKLYEELREEMKISQQRLEGANYRVGQLESQLKTAVPLLEHQKVLEGKKDERFNKRILYVLLGIVLALQPLWIIFVYF